MKLLNVEFRKKVELGDMNLGCGYVFEFEGMAPLFGTPWYANWYSAEDLMKLRGGIKDRNAPIWTWYFKNLEPIPAPVLGLSDGDWVFKIDVSPVLQGSQGMLFVDCEKELLVKMGEESCVAWARDRGWKELWISKDGKKVLRQVALNLGDCEGLLEFLVSPARHYEAKEREIFWDIEKKKKTQNNWIEKKNKWKGLEMK